MYCGNCGAFNPEGADASFCRSCGAELSRSEVSSSNVQVGGDLPPGYSPYGAGTVLAPGGLQAAVFPYGGFWIRVVAYFIDGLILVVAGVFLAVFFPGISGGAGLEGGMTLHNLIALAYPVVCPPLLGATPGKLALGYHIVGEDGRHIGYGRSIVRAVGQIVSGLALLLGYFWIGIDSRKQGWHDKIAGTFVVRREFVRS